MKTVNFLFVSVPQESGTLCVLFHVVSFPRGSWWIEKTGCDRLIFHDLFDWLQIEFGATDGSTAQELIILRVKQKMMYFWDLM